jgi:hypothetical protein
MGAWFWWMGGVQDRFTLVEVKDMISGFPGTLGTPATKSIYQSFLCIFQNVQN